MADNFDWFGILGMLAILGTMFLVPTVVFARDWQRQKAAERAAAQGAAADADEAAASR